MQSIIRAVTNISLKGRYIHKFESTEYFKGVIEEKTSFLPVDYLKLYTGISELIFSEPVGTSVGYTIDGKVILNNDNKYRKEVSKAIIRGTLQGVKDLIEEEIEVPYNDIIIILNRFLLEPTIEEAKFGNSKLFENGSYNNDESIVWYDRSLIEKGKVRECYNRSYWKTAFKVLMKNDPEYKFLIKEVEK
jgi:hypothetical protein